MSFQQRRAIIYIISTLLILVGYIVYISQKYSHGEIDPEGDLKFWGSLVLIMVPILIGVNIVVHIIAAIADAIATREEPDIVTDELDKLIELRSMRNSYSLFMIGFLLAMVTLVMSYPVFVMFNVIVGSMLASQLFHGVSQLYFYRRGF